MAKEYAGVFMCDSGACYRNYSMSQILGMIQQHKLALHRVQEAKGESMPHPDDYDWPERNLPTVKEEQVYINGWGQKTRIDKMGTQHIINCIGLCQKKRERLMAVQADFEETKCLEPAIKELEDTICALCDELNNRRLN
ncbi:MAG: hypothetical protein GWO08_01670 [Gammaproteobacteria bacterium]|nr:hypothetical protein [Desulfobacterales bacterium]NIR92415.1 hypothetical protein [Gammaproteobacteria bacterium]